MAPSSLWRFGIALIPRAGEAVLSVNQEKSGSQGPRSAGVDGLVDLFPDADYRLQMRFARGPVADFFNPWSRPADVLEQRRHWLRHEPAAYSAILAGGDLLLEEMIEQSRRWAFSPPLAPLDASPPQIQSLLKIGESLETDFLLLRPEIGRASCRERV